MWKVVAFLIEGIGWLQIVAGPLLGGCGLGVAVYCRKPDATGLVLAIVSAVVGLVAGIVIATRIWKKTGTTRFLS